MKNKIGLLTACSLAVCVMTGSVAIAQDSEELDNISVSYSEGGRSFTEDDVPTFLITEDGVVDWPTFSGFRRYHSECHVCHGPDGEGSSYAPSLKKSAIDMDYYDFLEVIASGRKVVNASANQVMPAFGTNKNVMCFIDDIYVYLKARGTETIPRGRPGKKVKKPDELRAEETECLDG